MCSIVRSLKDSESSKFQKITQKIENNDSEVGILLICAVEFNRLIEIFKFEKKKKSAEASNRKADLIESISKK